MCGCGDCHREGNGSGDHVGEEQVHRAGSLREEHDQGDGSVGEEHDQGAGSVGEKQPKKTDSIEFVHTAINMRGNRNKFLLLRRRKKRAAKAEESQWI